MGHAMFLITVSKNLFKGFWEGSRGAHFTKRVPLVPLYIPLIKLSTIDADRWAAFSEKVS